MTLETIDMHSLPEGVEEHLQAIVTELQGLTVSVATGAAAAADIAVTGIATVDTLVGVIRLHVVPDTGTSATGNKISSATDLKAEASITSAGHIRCSTTDTTGDTLLVIWFNKS